MSIHEKTSNSEIEEIISFTYPRLYTGKDWYVGFYAFDPAKGKMRRKRIKINFIEKIGDRRRYAQGLIRRLIIKLDNGWNPWVEAESSKAYHKLPDVLNHYRRYIEKMFQDNIYREDTYTSYISYLRNIEKWNNSLQVKYTYIYQFDRTFVQQFLEHIYIERNNKPQTRDNYLMFLRVLSSFLVQNSYLKTKPTEGIAILSRRKQKKNREVIIEKDMIRLRNYLMGKNKHYLLACYILHYCFIRPKEMSMMKLEHISIKNQTIFIPDTNSKNRDDGTVTLPANVIKLMIDLNVFNYDNDYYLFSDNFEPGRNQRSEKVYRDYWIRHVRKDLKFPATYKFYSLKDTGITNMLRKHDLLTVRDQARHADVLMTDKYTPHDLMVANDLIKNYSGVL